MSFLDCMKGQIDTFLKDNEKAAPAVKSAMEKRAKEVEERISKLDLADPNYDKNVQNIYNHTSELIRQDSKALVYSYKKISEIKSRMLKESGDGVVRVEENAIKLINDLDTKKRSFIGKVRQFFNGIDDVDVNDINTVNFLKELDGIDTGDKLAQQIADAMRKYNLFKNGEKQANGIYVIEKKGYDLQRLYNRDALRNVNQKEFVKISIEKNFFKDTPTSLDRKTDYLNKMYLFLTGRSDIDPTIGMLQQSSKSTVFNDLTRHRGIEFNEGKFAEFNELWGFNAIEYITRDVNSNSKLIARANVLGLSEDSSLKSIKNIFIDKLGDKGEGKFKGIVEGGLDYFKDSSGSVSSVAGTLNSFRKFMTSIIMGATLVKNLVGDSTMNGIQSWARGSGFFKGLYNVLSAYSGGRAKELGKYLNVINGHNILDCLDDIKGMGLTNIRKSKLDSVSDFLWKANLVDASTTRQRAAYATSFFGDLTRNKNMGFEEFNKKSNGLLKNNFITENDWNVYRNSQAINIDEADFITYKEIKDVQVADKIEKMYLREMDKSVIGTSLRGRDVLSAGLGSKTIGGEAVMTLTQFWGWTHGYYAAVKDFYQNNTMSTMNKVGFLGGSFSALVVADYLGESIKELLKGNSPKFSEEGFGRSFLNTFGATGDAISAAIFYKNPDLLDKPVFGGYGAILNFGKEMFDKKKTIGSSFYKLQKTFNPLYTNVFTKSLNRYVDESVRGYLDPKGLRKSKSAEKGRLKENNQYKIFD